MGEQAGVPEVSCAVCMGLMRFIMQTSRDRQSRQAWWTHQRVSVRVEAPTANTMSSGRLEG